ncbi:hypothetical protein [Arthrobacter sp.]|uniref:GTP pyrophosphokinase n=1 Tax=Arthrobacter sp. TaxID=1667 RepID=UPI00289B9923|nr:hypothetical protein [Arthrobacter sp.]
MELPSVHSGQVDLWAQAFRADRPQFEAAEAAIYAAVVARLGDDGLNYHHIQHRVKGTGSLSAKLSRLRPDGTPKYPSGMRDIDDVIGLRVILFLESDIGGAINALGGAFDQLGHVDKASEQRSRGEFGYSGQHLVLAVPARNPPPGCGLFSGQRFEVQLRTILQHAWAEFEHDIRYKGGGAVPPEVNRAFTLASGLIELADREFDTINELVTAQKARDERESVHALAAPSMELTADAVRGILEHELPQNPRSRADQYEWLVEVLRANGVVSVPQAYALFKAAEWAVVSRRIEYRFRPGHVRAADDVLLLRFGSDYVERTHLMDDDGTRRAKLEYRLGRLGG